MSISPQLFLKHLIRRDILFFTGVPDSLLKYLCLCIDQSKDLKSNHIITSNEGAAIGLASGYHIGTNKVPLVYMQNSGIGNAINPLLSLADSKVYSIPMLILIGWRGEPGVKDEPQHLSQGEVQIDLLNALKIPFDIISKNNNDYKLIIDRGLNYAKEKSSPFVILIKKNTFSKIVFNSNKQGSNTLTLTREYCLGILLKSLPKNSIIVSTTGKTSREIFELRKLNNQPHENDFLTIGSMGHCSSIALGIAKTNPHLNIFCIDGDGSIIMHMGTLSTIGQELPDNFHHILINNYSHESVGGQKTSSEIIDFNLLSKSLNYKDYYRANNKNSLNKLIKEMLNNSNKPALFEIQVQPGSRSDLGRPTVTPKENKIKLMKKINELSKK
tara:strand:+ start:1294 stop:2448 length:1155 start_codon:yes stop_codon:yes gene_type:complete